MNLGEITWQFNEAVSLLRDARAYLPGEYYALADEIKEGLPAIQAALEALAAMPAQFDGSGAGLEGSIPSRQRTRSAGASPATRPDHGELLEEE